MADRPAAPAREYPDSAGDPLHQAQSKVRSFIYSQWGHAGEENVRPALDALDELVALAARGETT